MPDKDFEGVMFFEGLNATQRALVQPLFAWREEDVGTVLFKQGDLAEHLYIIVRGEVSIQYKPEDGPIIPVAHVRPEGVVGWSAALGNPYYTSSAVCASECRILRVRGEDLRALCAKYPETGAIILERLAALIAARLRNTHGYVLTLLEEGLRVNQNRVVSSAPVHP